MSGLAVHTKPVRLKPATIGSPAANKNGPMNSLRAPGALETTSDHVLGLGEAWPAIVRSARSLISAARLFGTSEQTVRRWRAGAVQVPGDIADWLVDAVPLPLVAMVITADDFAVGNPPPKVGRK